MRTNRIGSVLGFAIVFFSASQARAQEPTPLTNEEQLAQLPMLEAPPPAPLPPPQQQQAAQPVGTTSTTSAAMPPQQPFEPLSTEERPAASTREDDTRVMKPRQIDAKMAMNVDSMLHYVGLGVSGEIGLRRVGPGTIAVGGGLEYDFCGSTCWTFSSSSPGMTFTERHIFPQARASYHFSVPGASRLDLYPFAGMGPVFARSEVGVENGAARYTSTDTALGINMGFGGNMFIGKGPIFVGGEARIRYAAGDYAYRLESGNGTRPYDKGSVDTWSLNGLDVLIALGVRMQ